MDTLLGLVFTLAFGRAIFAPAFDEIGYRMERKKLAKRDIHSEGTG